MSGIDPVYRPTQPHTMSGIGYSPTQPYLMSGMDLVFSSTQPYAMSGIDLGYFASRTSGLCLRDAMQSRMKGVRGWRGGDRRKRRKEGVCERREGKGEGVEVHGGEGGLQGREE
eukprot:525408-Rhodomonas_salina.1